MRKLTDEEAARQLTQFCQSFPELVAEGLRRVILPLAPSQESLISLRFGLFDGRSRALGTIGRQFNLTRERIRQREAKALRRLRHPSNRNKLDQLLEFLGDD